MASGRPTTAGDDAGFPVPHSRGTPSVISSRLSGDDGDRDGQRAVPEASRPDTGKTTGSLGERKEDATKTKRTSGIAPKRDTWSNANEGSARTRTLTRGSHVPSLTSNAFFRPMSSQKLQAHRGAASRPPTTSQQLEQIPLDDDATDIGGSVMPRKSSSSTPPLAFQNLGHRDHPQLPPSRGTENTDQDHVTAETSPTNGQYPAASLSDSAQPLHKVSEENRPRMNINVDKSYQDIGRSATSPMKSPRSFRSSFLLSGRSDSGRHNRSTERAEKLSSGASSPKFNRVPSQPQTPATPSQPGSGGRNGRVHEYFEGNTNFYLGGRWQNTMGRPINIMTGALILLPCGLFYGFEASWLWHNISPAVPLVFSYLAFVCFSSFLHASISDPGILPRNLHQFPPLDQNEDPLRLGPRTNDWTLVKSAESKTAAMEVPVKHCRTCNIWRPPRSHHCRLCDNCIEGHDHHCVWINNCVGKRNYRFFFTFIITGTLLGLFALATSLVQLIVYQNRENISFGASVNHFRGALALLILSVLALLYPAALMGYHVFLMARGETTREYMNSHKFTKNERFRAYSQGSFWKNIWVVLCRPRTPTYYQFKSKYQHGDQRLGNTRRALRPKGEDRQGHEMQNVPIAPGQVPPSSQGFQGPVALRSAGGTA